MIDITNDGKSIIIPGVQKCGTTVLWKLLKQHPKIYPPNGYTVTGGEGEYKEIHYFSVDKATVRDNIDWYINQFPQHREPDSYTLDASTSYFNSHNACENILDFLSDTKVIICLRDPVERIYSAFVHNSKQKRFYDSAFTSFAERRDLFDILPEVESKEPDSVCTKENNIIQKAIDCGEIREGYIDEDFFKNKYDATFTAEFDDPLFLFRYFQLSSYSKFVEMYRRYFDDDDVKLVFMSQLIDNTQEVMSDIFNYLDIKTIDIRLPENNGSLVPNNKFGEIAMKLIASHFSIYQMSKSIPLVNYLINKSKDYLVNKKTTAPTSFRTRAKEILRYEYNYWVSKYPQARNHW